MAANTYKAVVKARLVGTVEVRNVFYVQVEDNAHLATEIAAWITSIYSPLSSFLSHVFVCYGLDIYVMQQGHWILSSENSLQFAGTSQSGMEPYQMAAVLIARTLVPRCIPKKFFGGLADGCFDSGLCSSYLLGALITVGANWIVPFTGSASQASYTPGTYSKKHESFIAFSGVLTDNVAGTQRRRKPGVGI